MTKENPDNLLKLPAEVRKNLQDLGSDIEKAERAIATLERIGLDTTAIKDKLKWAKNVRETLLTEFS